MKALARKPHPTETVSLELKFGEWRMLFSDRERKLVVAESLNECVFKDGMHIRGYLISHRTLYLLLETEPDNVPKQLLLLSEKARRIIKRYLDAIPLSELPSAGKEISAASKLFTPFPFVNDHLKSLITGKTVSLPYYDPHLERLKKQVRNYTFCSAVDYAGGKSPVHLTKEDFESDPRYSITL